MKIYKITESYVGYIDYVVKADSEKEAMKLYNDDIAVSYTHLPSPRDLSTSRMPSSA